jgi:hypothetical protein
MITMVPSVSSATDGTRVLPAPNTCYYALRMSLLFNLVLGLSLRLRLPYLEPMNLVSAIKFSTRGCNREVKQLFQVRHGYGILF